MDIGLYYVGQIPSRPMNITVRDDTGAPVDLTMYNEVKVVMVGSDNEYLDLSDATVQVADRRGGKVTFFWPEYTLFDQPGEYVMQLELLGNGSRDFTTERTLKVKQIGGRR